MMNNFLICKADKDKMEMMYNQMRKRKIAQVMNKEGYSPYQNAKTALSIHKSMTVGDERFNFVREHEFVRLNKTP